MLCAIFSPRTIFKQIFLVQLCIYFMPTALCMFLSNFPPIARETVGSVYMIPVRFPLLWVDLGLVSWTKEHSISVSRNHSNLGLSSTDQHTTLQALRRSPTLFEQHNGFFYTPQKFEEWKELWDGAHGFSSFSEKTRTSNHFMVNSRKEVEHSSEIF